LFQYATEILCPLKVGVQARDAKWIKEKCLNAFHRVSCGSCVPPIFLELNYCGGQPGANPIVLVGMFSMLFNIVSFVFFGI
jgi:aminopeptidase